MFGRRKKDWLRGTARVVGVNPPPHAATHSGLCADVVVEAPGLPAYATEYKELIVSISKWPAPGEVLPVRINPKDHHDLDVVWDEVKTGAEASRDRAEQMAEAMRTESQTTGWSSTTSTGLNASVDSAIVDTLRQVFPNPQVSVGHRRRRPVRRAARPDTRTSGSGLTASTKRCVSERLVVLMLRA